MRKSSLKIWLVATVVLGLALTEKTCAEVPVTAKNRAAFYQAEAARVFSNHAWRITQNRLGRLTMLHAAQSAGQVFPDPFYDPGPSGMGSIMAHLTITFRPESTTSTRCFVQITSYNTTGKYEAGKPQVFGPFDANSPKNAQYVREKLASAEKWLLRRHPEYAAR